MTVLLGAFAAVSVLPLLLSHVRLIGINRDALKTAEEQYILRSAVKIAGDIDAFLLRAQGRLETIADGLGLAERIGGGTDPFTYAGTERLLAEAAKEPFLPVLQTLNAAGQGLKPEELEGAIQAELARAHQTALRGEEYLGETFPTRAFPDGGLVKGVPVRSADGRVIGSVCGFLSLLPVKGWLEDEKKRDVVAYVVDRSGALIVASDPSQLAPQEFLPRVELVREFIAHPVRLTKSYVHGEGMLARRVLGTVAPVEGIDWGVLVEKDEEKAYASVAQMTRTTSLGAALALALAVAVAFVAARLLSRPVTELVEKVRAIAGGEYKQRVPVRGARELAELSETFNSMSDAIERSIEALKQAARENQELFLNSIRALAAAIDAKDPYTRGHSERVARYSVVIARHMGLTPEEVRKVRISALLHDVGKIGIDDRILRKPTALTDEEFDVMKTHPVKGALIMGQIPQMKDVIPGMKYHHEKWSGGGYPDGLKEGEIPMLARIIAVADTFDAMTTTRPYQKAMQLDYVVSRIQSFSGSRFDPAVVAALEKAFASKDLEVVGEAARMAASA